MVTRGIMGTEETSNPCCEDTGSERLVGQRRFKLCYLRPRAHKGECRIITLLDRSKERHRCWERRLACDMNAGEGPQ